MQKKKNTSLSRSSNRQAEGRDSKVTCLQKRKKCTLDKFNLKDSRVDYKKKYENGTSKKTLFSVVCSCPSALYSTLQAEGEEYNASQIYVVTIWACASPDVSASGSGELVKQVLGIFFFPLPSLSKSAFQTSSCSERQSSSSDSRRRVHVWDKAKG